MAISRPGGHWRGRHIGSYKSRAEHREGTGRPAEERSQNLQILLRSAQNTSSAPSKSATGTCCVPTHPLLKHVIMYLRVRAFGTLSRVPTAAAAAASTRTAGGFSRGGAASQPAPPGRAAGLRAGREPGAKPHWTPVDSTSSEGGRVLVPNTEFCALCQSLRSATHCFRHV